MIELFMANSDFRRLLAIETNRDNALSTGS